MPYGAESLAPSTGQGWLSLASPSTSENSWGSVRTHLSPLPPPISALPVQIEPSDAVICLPTSLDVAFLEGFCADVTVTLFQIFFVFMIVLRSDFQTELYVPVAVCP